MEDLRLKKSVWEVVTISLTIVMLFTVSIGHTPDVADCAISMDAKSIAVPSGVVWSDNFDDEDISDWQLFTVNHTASPDTLLPGNSTAVGGVLRHIGEEWSYAGHNSSVAFGTWSFDVDIQVPVDEYHFYVVFISEVFDNDWLTYAQVGSAYGVGFYIYDHGMTELRIVRGSHESGPLFMDDYFEDTIIGWRNLIITRELSGQFYVYLDGSLILKAKNMDHTTSERLYFLSHGGPAIDNVTVSDTIDYDAAPPEYDPPISTQRIFAGEPFYYDVNATDYSGIANWWISDTQNFTIDENGVITNNTELVVREYIVAVYVNDTLGHTQSDLFSLFVDPAPTSSIPLELMAAVIGIPAVVVIALVVWRKKKS